MSVEVPISSDSHCDRIKHSKNKISPELMTITHLEDCATATQQLTYILLEHANDHSIISLYTAEDISVWLTNVVIPTKNYEQAYELSRAAIKANLFNSYVVLAFIESCNYLNKLEDLKLLETLPSSVL